jgi:hypothetical protein
MTICCQIWLNTHFGYITKSTKKQGGTGFGGIMKLGNNWWILMGSGLFCRDEISPLGDKIKQVMSCKKDFLKYKKWPKATTFQGKKG